jgi:hypothetical protein
MLPIVLTSIVFSKPPNQKRELCLLVIQAGPNTMHPDAHLVTKVFRHSRPRLPKRAKAPQLPPPHVGKLGVSLSHLGTQ